MIVSHFLETFTYENAYKLRKKGIITVNQCE